MSAVNELIVREYFEGLGYQIQQPCKYLVSGRAKRPEEEADLLIRHPGVAVTQIPEHVLWTNEDLRTIGQAVVCVYGWHGERIYPAMLENLPEIVRFVAPESLRAAHRALGSDQAANILCLPKLPASAILKQQLLSRLREKGVHGVLLFRNILRTLIHQVDASRNYDKSDVLQVIRILKIYDLLQSAQLELFNGRRSRRRSKGTAPRERT
ncbi:MAG: hypothetical protein ACOYCD_00820 [Kiritimatiellia bacterium]|jgi:hypothetical protein